MKREVRALPYSVLTSTRRECIVAENDKRWYNDVAARSRRMRTTLKTKVKVKAMATEILAILAMKGGSKRDGDCRAWMEQDRSSRWQEDPSV